MAGARAWVALTAGVALAGCGLLKMDKEADGVAQAFFTEVRTGADLSADQHIDPALKTPAAAAGLAAIRQALPAGAPGPGKGQGFNFDSTAGTGSVARLSDVYNFPGGHAVTIQTGLRKPPGATIWFVTGIEADLGGTQAPIVVGTPPASPSPSDSN